MAGKAEQELGGLVDEVLVAGEEAGVEEVLEEGLDKVAAELASDEAALPGTDAAWSASRPQTPPAQENPNGQQPAPHTASGTCNAVVLRLLLGCSVAFCSARSHAIGSTDEQSSPRGQHSSVVLAASAMQTALGGQQKSAGREVSAQVL